MTGGRILIGKLVQKIEKDVRCKPLLNGKHRHPFLFNIRNWYEISADMCDRWP